MSDYIGRTNLDIVDRLKKALSLHQAGQLAPAEEIYLEILKSSPKHPDAHHLLGLIAKDRRDHDRALNLILRAIELSPANPDYQYNLGVILKDTGRHVEALRSFEKTLELRPDYIEAHINAGAVCLDMDNSDEALSKFKDAIELMPDNPVANNGMGRALQKIGRINEAIEYYQKALELKSDYTEAYYSLGYAYQTQNNFDAALSIYRNLIATHSNYAEAYVNMGRILQIQGNLDEAIECYRKDLLLQVKTLPCDITRLGSIEQNVLQDIFLSADYAIAWEEVEKKISTLTIAGKLKDVTPEGGIGLSDGRALYTLVRHFQPKRILEIGTHIGSSTTFIALAIRQLQLPSDNETFSLTTVDIIDVNNEQDKHWLNFGSAESPLSMLKKVGCEKYVKFIQNVSLNFFAECENKFDLIFLDGNHFYTNVYQEIPLALSALEQGGLILFHDYYPNFKPLSGANSMIPGPALAVERFRSEGVRVRALPFGGIQFVGDSKPGVSTLALLVKE